MKMFHRKFTLSALLCGLCIALNTPADAAVVFMYHRFGEATLPSTNVSLAQFKSHLDYLARQRFTIWPLSRIGEHLEKHIPLPDHVVALSVDDAYESVYTQAYPLIKARHWPMTVFVSTDAVDQHLHGYMTWEQMREMQENGITFANHSRTHGHLIELEPGETAAAWQQRISDEISYAQQRLEKELGPTAKLFAYPYGEYNPALQKLLAGLGFLAFGQQSGAIGSLSKPQLLPRFPMAENYAELEQFRIKADALPFPVQQVEPASPIINGKNLSPTLTVSVIPEQLPRLKELACYLNGERMTLLSWQDPFRFTVTPSRPLTARRSRYNCTVPSSLKGRYHWFSHLWINPAVAEP